MVRLLLILALLLPLQAHALELAGEFTKGSAEVLTASVEFEDRIPDEITIEEGTVEAVEYPELISASSVLVSGTGTVSGTRVLFGVQAGAHGKRYRIKVTAELSDGQVLQTYVLMKIDDL